MNQSGAGGTWQKETKYTTEEVRFSPNWKDIISHKVKKKQQKNIVKVVLNLSDEKTKPTLCLFFTGLQALACMIPGL